MRKKINSIYELTDIHAIDCDRLVVSATETRNKSDIRYIVGYKTDDSRVIPLYVKTAANCYSNGLSQYNENSAWKMSLDISGVVKRMLISTENVPHGQELLEQIFKVWR